MSVEPDKSKSDKADKADKAVKSKSAKSKKDKRRKAEPRTVTNVKAVGSNYKPDGSIVEAAMILHALGDTIGFKNGEWEFNKDYTFSLNYTNELIYEFINLGGINSIDLSDWIVSDDTIFHYFVGKAMLEYDGVLDDKYILKFKYALTNASKLIIDSKMPRYIGNTTKKSIADFELNHDARDEPYNSYGGGNGCAMRNLVIGLCLYEESKLKELIDLSIVSSMLTHHNAIGYLGGFTAAYFTSLAVRKVDIRTWPYLLVEQLNSDYLASYIKKTVSDETRDFIDFKEAWLKHIDNRFDENRALIDLRAFKNPMYRMRYYFSNFYSMERDRSRLSTQIGGSGVLAMIMAYDAAMDSGGVWEKLLVFAILNAGDSDTVGAIAGGLFGTYYGFSDTPARMYEKLEFKEELLRLVTGIKKKYFSL